MVIRLLKVKGSSMLPAYHPNQYVICWRWPATRFQIGDVVVVRHSVFGLIIKRVADIHPAKGFWLQGDNPQSTSSEQLGWVDKAQLVGRVIYSSKP